MPKWKNDDISDINIQTERCAFIMSPSAVAMGEMHGLYNDPAHGDTMTSRDNCLNQSLHVINIYLLEKDLATGN